MIVNPVSGGADNRGLVAALQARLRGLGRESDALFTAARGDARRFAAGVAADTPVVLAIGGDGTVNEVIDGLVGRPVPVLIVPRGTENLLGKYLRIPISLEWLAAAANWPRTIEFDVAVANDRHFLCVSGVGFDAEVIRRLEHRRRGHIGYNDYFWPLWRTFWGWRFPPIRIEADGKAVFDDRGLAFVGNANRYAFNLGILRDARPDDGLLDLCIYRCGWQGRLLVHSANTLLGRHIGRPGVIYLKAQRVRIWSPRVLPVEIDGELYGVTPIDYSVLPQAARLVVGPSEPRAKGSA